MVAQFFPTVTRTSNGTCITMYHIIILLIQSCYVYAVTINLQEGIRSEDSIMAFTLSSHFRGKQYIEDSVISYQLYTTGHT